MSKPAARLTDMHVCPMQTPAVVPIPHVGGPIVSPGDPKTLIAGLPAARVGDMCVCVGPPDVIAMGSFTVLIGGKPAARMGDMTVHGGSIVAGCPTVLIGDAGGGGGSPQAFTMGAAKAKGAAFTKTNCGVAGVAEAAAADPAFAVADPTKKSWIEVELVDQKGRPVPHERYRVVPPGGAKPVEGFLDEHGYARVGGIDPGTCTITFPDLDAASWKPEKGDPGRTARPDPPPGYRPSVAKVAARPLYFGRPSIGAVKTTVVVAVRPGIGAVAARRLGPGIGGVTVRAVESKARFVAQLPAAVRAGSVVTVRDASGREVHREEVGTGGAFVTIPLDPSLLSGAVTIGITLPDGLVLHGLVADLARLRVVHLTGGLVEQYGKAVGLDLTRPAGGG